MRASTLPNLHGLIDNGLHLRIQLAKALSRVEVYRKRGQNEPASAAALKAFLQAGITSLDAGGVTSIAISPTTNSGAAGGTVQTTVTFTPSTALNKGVTYTTSDATKATVSATGLITRVATGSATITARSVADPTNTATVAVTVS